MISVLINAYAISPDWGSEQGVGWNWVTNIARHCEVHVITEGEYRERIEEEIAKLPWGTNIHMYYVCVSARVRQMCWNQGDYRFYFFYDRWQRHALKLARQIMKDVHIDVIHFLNMVGFREPGQLWRIEGVPYVWGPMGGSEKIDLRYFEGDSLKTRLKYRFKNAMNYWQMRHTHKVCRAFRRADALITPVAQMQKEIQAIYGKTAVIIPETGLDSGCVALDEVSRNVEGPFRLLWVGRFVKRKQLEIALMTMALVKNAEVELHVAGFGMNGEDEHYRKLADELGVSDRVIWHGRTDNEKVQKMMRGSDLLFFTSINEITSTVVPEAIRNRLPILCHDICGFGPLIDDSIGRKIEMSTPRQSAERFAAIIDQLSSDRQTLNAMKANFDGKAEKLTYQSKAEQVYEIYSEICRKKK